VRVPRRSSLKKRAADVEIVAVACSLRKIETAKCCVNADKKVLQASPVKGL